MTDLVAINPAQAGALLAQTQTEVKAFVNEINELAQVLRETAACVFSWPLQEVMQLLATELNEAGEAVTASYSSYASAFTEVIDRWKQTDATGASALSTAATTFERFTIPLGDTTVVYVQPAKVTDLVSRASDHSNNMHTHFSNVNDQIAASKSFLIGPGSDKTRATFVQHVWPLDEQVQKLMSKWMELMGQQLTDFLRRDEDNYVTM